MNKQKGLVPILIIILIAVMAVGGYLIYQNQTKSTVVPQQIAQPSPSPDETANWKTYKSMNAGIEFKYPADCEAPIEGVSSISLACYADKNIDRSLGGVITNEDLTVEVNYVKNSGNKSLDEYLNEVKKTYPQIVNVRDLLIGGQPARAWRSEGQLVNNDFYHVVNRGESFDIVKYPIDTNKQTLFNQILSTFKFTQ